jgi:hypothetical protein
MTSKETENRKRWKEARAQSSYGMSYDALCCDRKHVIDQIYTLLKTEQEEKNKKGCR